MLHVPHDGFSLAITAMQCLNLGAFANELKSPTPYSKFAEQLADSGNKLTLPSRQGMLLIYLPAMATSAACLAGAPIGGNGREIIVRALLLLHFAKRVAETLFVHEYSGSASAPVAGFIGVYYALTAWLVSAQQSGVPASLYAGGDAALAAGLSAFVIGQAGNLYHHHLLAAMRRRPAEDAVAAASAVPTTPSTSTALEQPAAQRSKYAVPTGALFDYVTMPHYFFEIVVWLGIAMVAQQLNALLVALGMSSYLSGRAVATTAWYKARFGKEWPARRKHLVPFLF